MLAVWSSISSKLGAPWGSCMDFPLLEPANSRQFSYDISCDVFLKEVN
jgi:hypothetical protein